jgi:hypothetical protein
MYKSGRRNFTVDVSTMQVVKESTTLALSDNAVFLGTGNSDYSQYHTNIQMDEMLQVEQSSAGNLHWEHLRPAPGMVRRRVRAPSFQRHRQQIPAVSIDLVPAYALAILHFEFAGVIVLFAIFCALIPKTASVGADRHTAHAKLSDFSKLKAEVVGTRSVDAQGLIDSNHSTTISVWDAEGSNVGK